MTGTTGLIRVLPRRAGAAHAAADLASHRSPSGASRDRGCRDLGRLAGVLPAGERSNLAPFASGPVGPVAPGPGPGPPGPGPLGPGPLGPGSVGPVGPGPGPVSSAGPGPLGPGPGPGSSAGPGARRAAGPGPAGPGPRSGSSVS